MSEKPIFVTQPHLPPLAEFIPYLENIWESKFLTNGGPYHQQLEKALCEYFGVEHISLFANGTLALVTALQALRITGEVITTPYSFVATSHSLVWNGIKPIFVDIEPATLSIDPKKIEAAITPQTTAILAVHVYGQPGQMEALQRIADTYGLKLIYDAAHAFGVRDAGGSVLRHGDMSVLSFHATKVFNTFEGGAIVCKDAKTKQRIDYLKNFGFADEVTVMAPGINGKMSEINAAFGLLQLKHVEAALARRKVIDGMYREMLADLPQIECFKRSEDWVSNYAYFPIFVAQGSGLSRDSLYTTLREHNIYARRYFYPLISEFPMYRSLPSALPGNLPIATDIANRVLCLPIYPGMAADDVKRIIEVIQQFSC